MKIGDLVKSHSGEIGTVIEVDPPSKRTLRIAMVHFPKSGIDGYPEGWLEVVNESR